MTAPVSPGVVALLDGRHVSSWSAEWLAETLARELEVRAILPLPDREVRRARVLAYAARMEIFATVHQLPVEPAAYAAEARRRLEACILATWSRSHPSVLPQPPSVP